MLQLQPLMEYYESEGVVILTITSDPEEQIKQYWKDNNLDLKVLADKNMEIARAYKLSRYPTGILTDRNRKIADRTTGWTPANTDKLRRVIDDLL